MLNIFKRRLTSRLTAFLLKTMIIKLYFFAIILFDLSSNLTDLSIQLVDSSIFQHAKVHKKI